MISAEYNRADIPARCFDLGWYPFMFPTSDGKVVMAGYATPYRNGDQAAELAPCDPTCLSLTKSRRLDPIQMTWDATFEPDAGFNGGSAVYMYWKDTPFTNTYREDIIKGGSAIAFCCGFVGNKTVKRLRVNDTTAAWTSLPDMLKNRNHFYCIALPDGRIAAVGGPSNECGLPPSPPTPPLLTGEHVEIYNPYTNTWSLMAKNTHRRQYHSTATLLPDGSIFITGGDTICSGLLQPYFPEYTPQQFADLMRERMGTYEVYQPPYFFNGPRPTISSVSTTQIRYARPITVTTPDADNVTKVRLIRIGGATHSFHFDQRLVELEFTKTSSTTLRVTSPLTTFIAPPGYYLLFIATGENGNTPSTGTMIRMMTVTI